MTLEETYMREAIALSREGSRAGAGGPFGCVIVKDGAIIGRGYNKVLATNDPTAHAEVVAIRDACKNLNAFQLEDCDVYTSCEPCPMCLGALYWARPRAIYFANNRADAAAIGFDDSLIYEECNKPVSDRNISMHPVGRSEALKVFEEWKQIKNKQPY